MISILTIGAYIIVGWLCTGFLTALIATCSVNAFVNSPFTFDNFLSCTIVGSAMGPILTFQCIAAIIKGSKK